MQEFRVYRLVSKRFMDTGVCLYILPSVEASLENGVSSAHQDEEKQEN